MSTSSATQDAASSVDPVKRTPLEIKFGNDLIGRCLAAYWTDRQALIDDRCRMRAVVEVIADEVRRWAPDKGQAKICHLAINEVADRLLRDTNDL
jgi:hypothetical protein